MPRRRLCRQQVGNNMGGFVDNFAEQRPQADNEGIVMGYYSGADLPVYDHLAREFCVCDRWFSSLPGATWPNRLYAVAGQAAGSKDPKKIPIYDEPSFVRHLDANNVSWRWHTHDVATLRFSDGEYLLGHFDNFAYFDRRSFLAPRNFLDDAKDGNLPAVSWIDPNFIDVSFHRPLWLERRPPTLGRPRRPGARPQGLHGAAQQPQLEQDTPDRHYDEHGGFYDHVVPPSARDDKPAFRTYGARVPALVAPPFTTRGSVSNETFDHTSIIKTILLRFCNRKARSPTWAPASTTPTTSAPP